MLKSCPYCRVFLFLILFLYFIFYLCVNLFALIACHIAAVALKFTIKDISILDYIQLLEWSSQSIDLNKIKMLWRDLKHDLHVFCGSKFLFSDVNNSMLVTTNIWWELLTLNTAQLVGLEGSYDFFFLIASETFKCEKRESVNWRDKPPDLFSLPMTK